jgi:hypothetical protein
MTYMDEPQRWNDLLQTGNSTFCLSYIALYGSEYHVQNSEGEEVAVVRSIDDTWSALSKYYMENPRWHRTGTQYFKFTPFGLLQVERAPHVLQDASGKWTAYCNFDCLLAHDGEPAIFAAVEDAKCAAEEHLCDELVHHLTSAGGCSTFARSVQ